MRGRLLTALLSAVAALAGCLGGGAAPEEAAVGAVPPEGLAAGAFYAFTHDGGDVRLRFDGGPGADAVVSLFDGADRHVATVSLDGNGTREAVLGDVPGPEPVLWLDRLGGNLTVESRGRAVPSFTPLLPHVERHVLMERPVQPLALPMLTGGEGATETLDVQLRRPPAAMDILATHRYAEVQVTARGRLGVILEAADRASPFLRIPVLDDAGGFHALPSDLHRENLRDGLLNVTVEATDLEGAIILQAFAYSRAPLPQEAGATRTDTDGDAAFTYGPLPDRPVAFQVHPAATALFLFAEASEGGADAEAAPDPPTGAAAAAAGGDGTVAWVAVHGPDDRRIATVEVRPGPGVRVPVAGGGRHVAVALEGTAFLGADRAPADFELHPLETAETLFGPGNAGSAQDYEQEEAPVEAPGVPYAVLAASQDASLPPLTLPVACPEPGMLRLSQGGETLGMALDGADNWDQASRYLGAGPLTLFSDGFGADACDRPHLAVASYLRPTA